MVLTRFLQAAPAAALCALASCGLFSPGARVLVRIPEPPAHWQRAFPGLGFTLEYRDGSGRVQEDVVEDWRAPVEIICSKEQNSAILAYPCTAEGPPADAALRPAGGLFPLSLEATGGQEVLSLSWEDGCAALIVSRVKKLGRDMGRFNVSRLVERMRLAEDPWRWDAVTMAERIATGDFTAFDIELLPSRDVELTIVEGEWFLESPFAPVHGVGNDGKLALQAVALGPHTLFSMDGSEMRMYVGERETVVGPTSAYGSRMIPAFVSTFAPLGPMRKSFSHLTPP